ncbi:hypothetical protein K469DRAFT_685000 [Zopfia rhizophila CBS 207.26]|uniref:Uncharacterized protein n=1 Tax=Zopfia rhizophila CBS 207.26 TaxID=1314779 RepID=A0A6A6E8Y9_9PEZI|nr:hypothetical protein K469DRAFT_685000 [Zopfia rhizophila CBS 207.26]
MTTRMMTWATTRGLLDSRNIVWLSENGSFQANSKGFLQSTLQKVSQCVAQGELEVKLLAAIRIEQVAGIASMQNSGAYVHVASALAPSTTVKRAIQTTPILIPPTKLNPGFKYSPNACPPGQSTHDEQSAWTGYGGTLPIIPRSATTVDTVHFVPAFATVPFPFNTNGTPFMSTSSLSTFIVPRTGIVHTARDMFLAVAILNGVNSVLVPYGFQVFLSLDDVFSGTKSFDNADTEVAKIDDGME